MKKNAVVLRETKEEMVIKLVKYPIVTIRTVRKIPKIRHMKDGLREMERAYGDSDPPLRVIW